MNWHAATLALVIGMVSSGAGSAQAAQLLPAVCEDLDAQYKKFIELKHDYSNEIASLASNIACQQSNFSNSSEKNAFFEKLNAAKSKWNTEIDSAIAVMKNHNNISSDSIKNLNNLHEEMNLLKEKSKNFRNCTKNDKDKFVFVAVPAVYVEAIAIISGIASVYSAIDIYLKNRKEEDDRTIKEWSSCADSMANLKL